jgi:dimethylglycine dehydrogenase
LTQEDLSNESWKFMRSRQFTIAGIEAIGIRVSFTGDLGWEIYVAEADQAKLWDALFETGKDLGIMPVGGRSLGCLRIEKGYGSWSREYSPEYWPQEVGFEGLIKMDKPSFLGRAAYAAIMNKEPREKLVCLTIETDNADSSGGEPIFLADGTPVGRVSSGAYGFSVDQSCALAFIKTEYAVAGDEVEVAVLGRPHKAIILDRPAFDPTGARLRA